MLAALLPPARRVCPTPACTAVPLADHKGGAGLSAITPNMPACLPRPQDGGGAPAALDAWPTCQPCPANTLCTGGAVHAPGGGYWHSAPGSTRMHPCPQAQACRGRDAALQARLLACQEAWYTTRVPGEAVMADPRTQAALAAAGSGSGSSGNGGGVLAPVAATNASGVCLLAGVADGHPLSYMSLQCVPPYTGRLCATCLPGYALDVEFQCK